MVKFSAAVSKRRKLSAPSFSAASHSSSSTTDDLHSGEGEEDGVELDEAVVEGVGSSSSAGQGSGADSITVSIDPDVLDCPICFEPLSPPVFQCNNGHIACSSCCTKMKNKCHSCSFSIGSSRCLALEKVLESIQISCPHARNGCWETIVYSQSRAHKETCTYSPCSCPFLDCKFEGSVQQLSLHFSFKHRGCTILFEYNSFFAVSLDRNKPMLVLCGDNGLIILLHNNNGLAAGNFITLTCICPSSRNGDITYDLIAKSGERSLWLVASMESIERWVGVPPSKEFLLVPHDFSDQQGILNLEVCIHNSKA